MDTVIPTVAPFDGFEGLGLALHLTDYAANTLAFPGSSLYLLP